jgi:hypothetical protein
MESQNYRKKEKRGRGFSLSLIAVIVVCVVAAASVGMVLLVSRRETDAEMAKLTGRWIRPDGGYVLEIRGVMDDGAVDAAYYNPRPINVADAQLSRREKKPYLFIELRDTGYPGATYDLIYEENQDALIGVYYQPAIDQRFEVVFIRYE